MVERIEKFLIERKIEDELVRNILKECLLEFTKMVENIIPFDEIITRLETNLKSINFKRDNEKPSSSFTNMMAQYVGFEENSINLYFDKNYLNNEKLKQDFTDVLVHEVIHAICTIKNNDVLKTETQVFCTMENLGYKVTVKDGDDVFLEPIVNFIACLVQGKVNNLYVASTNSIFRLANTIPWEDIVTASFYSDEEMFKKCFPSIDAYEYFKKGLSFLNYGHNWYNRGKSIIDNYFIGNIPNKNRNFAEITSKTMR